MSDLTEIVPPSKEGREVFSRLTVTTSFYYQVPGNSPDGASPRFVSMLSTDEQWYVRWVKVGPEWTRVDPGWIEKCAYLLIDARESPEDVEISFSERPEKHLVARSRQFFQGTPVDLNRIWIRAEKPTRVQVYLIPE